MTALGSVSAVSRAYLLAGHAKRLPKKFLLPLGGERVVERQVRLLRSLGLEVAVVSVEPLELPSVPVLRDRYDRGPLGGLVTALEETDRPFFLFGADMPGLDVASLRAMRERFRGKALVPVDRAGALQVLHAIYSGRERDRARALLDTGAGIRKLVEELLAKEEAELLAPGAVADGSFQDLDTPSDYEAFFRESQG